MLHLSYITNARQDCWHIGIPQISLFLRKYFFFQFMVLTFSACEKYFSFIHFYSTAAVLRLTNLECSICLFTQFTEWCSNVDSNSDLNVEAFCWNNVELYYYFEKWLWAKKKWFSNKWWTILMNLYRFSLVNQIIFPLICVQEVASYIWILGILLMEKYWFVLDKPIVLMAIYFFNQIGDVKIIPK